MYDYADLEEEFRRLFTDRMVENISFEADPQVGWRDRRKIMYKPASPISPQFSGNNVKTQHHLSTKRKSRLLRIGFA